MDIKWGVGGTLANAIEGAREQFEEAGLRDGLVVRCGVCIAPVDSFYQAALHGKFHPVQPGVGAVHADRVLLDHRSPRIPEMELPAACRGMNSIFIYFVSEVLHR